MKALYIAFVILFEPFTRHFLDGEDKPGYMRNDHYRRY
jgi:hypothetical protein